MRCLYEQLRAERPDWSAIEAARVAAYWPRVSPDHGGTTDADTEKNAAALVTA